MPHFIIEYAAPLADELDPQILVNLTHQAGINSKLFTPSHIKVRAHQVEAYLIAGTPNRFIHVNALLLPGRTDAQRRDLAQGILDNLAMHVDDNVTISVETNELHESSYVKREYET